MYPPGHDTTNTYNVVLQLSSVEDAISEDQWSNQCPGIEYEADPA